MAGSKEIRKLIESAAKFHGHLGPFLVIGVRMGDMAKRYLGPDYESSRGLQASIGTPLCTPFSCVIDGIQASTCCTVGNQKLRIGESTKRITASFDVKDSGKTFKISVNPEVVETLTEEMSKGASVERLALEIADMPEEQLFVLEVRKSAFEGNERGDV